MRAAILLRKGRTIRRAMVVLVHHRKWKIVRIVREELWNDDQDHVTELAYSFVPCKSIEFNIFWKHVVRNDACQRALRLHQRRPSCEALVTGFASRQHAAQPRAQDADHVRDVQCVVMNVSIRVRLRAVFSLNTFGTHSGLRD